MCSVLSVKPTFSLYARHRTRHPTTSHVTLEMAGNINGDLKTPCPHKNKSLLSLHIA